MYAVVESVTKYVALGGDYKKAYLTFQEYFEKLRNEPIRWGKPFSALLGAYLVQKELKIGSIGGKDSMSGSYNELDVPPTLVSFAVGTVDINKVVSNEFKKTDSKVLILKTKIGEEEVIDFEDLKENYEIVHKLINDGKVLSIGTIKAGGIAETITKACIGNKIGFKFETKEQYFKQYYGSFIIEVEKDVNVEKTEVLGYTTKDNNIAFENEVLDLDEITKAWKEPLEKVFPTKAESKFSKIENILSDKKCNIISHTKFAAPRVFIPVFPGTNCEYDSSKAFEDAGAITDTLVFKNLKPQDITDTIYEMEKRINQAQIIMFPGGFSSGDEPDGSGKFIATVFRNPRLKEAINKHLYEQDGLILGICNGFQALIKLGLVPEGKIVEMTENNPTLTFNTISRHVSTMVKTKVVSKLSPWFNKVELREEFIIPISHGEGRFIANEETLNRLIANGQVATQYVDFDGNATYDINFNPNNSIYAIEGITSPDGRVLGKMGHSERCYSGILKNIPGNKDQKIFESGVEYFK